MIVAVYSSFAELPAAHQRVLAAHATGDFLCSHLWFQNLIDTALPAGVEVRLYAVEDAAGDSALRGLLAMRTPAAKRGSILQHRPYPGRSLSGLTNEKTILFGPVIPEPQEDLAAVLRCLVGQLRAERPRWNVIDLSTLDAAAESTAILATALRDAGYVVKSYHGHVNCYQPANGCFRAYRAALTKAGRKLTGNHLARYRRLAQSPRSRIELFEDSSDVERAIRDYNAVYEASWKARDFRHHFIPQLIATGLAARSVLLMILYIEDEPAAVELTLLSGQRGILYRTAYDPRFAEYSPGAVVTTKMIEQLIDRRGVTEIDLGRDDEEYKKTWVRQRRRRVGLIAFNCRTMGGMFGWCWRLGAGAWSMVHRKESA